MQYLSCICYIYIYINKRSSTRNFGLCWNLRKYLRTILPTSYTHTRSFFYLSEVLYKTSRVKTMKCDWFEFDHFHLQSHFFLHICYTINAVWMGRINLRKKVTSKSLFFRDGVHVSIFSLSMSFYTSGVREGRGLFAHGSLVLMTAAAE